MVLRALPPIVFATTPLGMRRDACLTRSRMGGEARGQGWKPTRTGKNRTDFLKSIMTMGIDKVADGWCLSRRHGEGGGHGEYIAMGGRAVLIDDDDRGLGVGSAKPETTC